MPKSQAMCSSLLEECFDIAQEIKARQESQFVAPQLKPIYDRLSEMRGRLEQLILTHRWTLRETDLYVYILGLQEIDQLRVDGKFVDAQGEVPPGQYVIMNVLCRTSELTTSAQVLLYTLRRCYGLIYRLLASSEPVSEEMMPIANKLSTVKKCLNEVLKYGGPFSPRELYPVRCAGGYLYTLTVHCAESHSINSRCTKLTNCARMASSLLRTVQYLKAKASSWHISTNAMSSSRCSRSQFRKRTRTCEQRVWYACYEQTDSGRETRRQGNKLIRKLDIPENLQYNASQIQWNEKNGGMCR